MDQQQTNPISAVSQQKKQKEPINILVRIIFHLSWTSFIWIILILALINAPYEIITATVTSILIGGFIITLIGAVAAQGKRNKNALAGASAFFLLYVVLFAGMTSGGLCCSARDKARDAQRRSDIAQYYRAINDYYDNNHKYPSTSKLKTPDASNDAKGEGAIGNLFLSSELFRTVYLAENLKAPTSGNHLYDHYYYLDDRNNINEPAKNYIVYTMLEAANKKYFYAINNVGNVWDIEQAQTTPPTCVPNRVPVCGY